MKITLFFYVVLFILTSCKKEPVTQEVCEDWAMLSYQGKPFEAKRLKTECTHFKLKYDKDVCQKAFESFVMSGKIEEVQKNFGDRIINCFTSDDLKRFKK